MAQFGLELPGLWDQCLSGVLVLNDPQSTQSPLVTLVVWGESLVFLPSSFHFFSFLLMFRSVVFSSSSFSFFIFIPHGGFSSRTQWQQCECFCAKPRCSAKRLCWYASGMNMAMGYASKQIRITDCDGCSPAIWKIISSFPLNLQHFPQPSPMSQIFRHLVLKSLRPRLKLRATQLRAAQHSIALLASKTPERLESFLAKFNGWVKGKILGNHGFLPANFVGGSCRFPLNRWPLANVSWSTIFISI